MLGKVVNSKHRKLREWQIFIVLVPKSSNRSVHIKLEPCRTFTILSSERKRRQVKKN
jgi:hypothetical protein